MITDQFGTLLVEVNRSRTAAAGVDPSEYHRVTDGLEGLGAWPAAFLETAAGHLELAQLADTAGRTISAANARADASLWFHFAACVPDADTTTVQRAERNAAASLWAALTRERPAAVRLEKFDGDPPFVALVQRPAGVVRPPVVIIIPGLDSSKEEFQPLARELVRRGMASVSIDGPGQGETVAAAPPCPDYERVVGAVLNHMAALDLDLDLDRVAAVGLSLGGYYVARAAAFEPRLRVAVAVTGPYSLGDWDALPPPLQRTLAVRAGGPAPARAITARINLAGTAEKIAQPLLVVCGEQDPVVSPADMHRLAGEAPAAQLLALPYGDHLCANTTWKWRPYATDWLANHLGATPPEQAP